MKFYAVRKGKITGIFTSWDECKDAVTGYSGAEYKSFSSKEEADKYLNGDFSASSQFTVKPKDGELAVFVDGSFDVTLQRYAFGCIFVTPGGSIHKRCGNGHNPDSLALRNISGEMLGAMYAARTAIKSGYKKVTLYHDYEGIAKWALGEWTAKKELTQKYAEEMKRLSQYIQIVYVKVTAHTNNYYNDMADSLAKGALRNANGIPKIEALR